jgi:hypothetical protein
MLQIAGLGQVIAVILFEGRAGIIIMKISQIVIEEIIVITVIIRNRYCTN